LADWFKSNVDCDSFLTLMLGMVNLCHAAPSLFISVTAVSARQLAYRLMIKRMRQVLNGLFHRRWAEGKTLVGEAKSCTIMTGRMAGLAGEQDKRRPGARKGSGLQQVFSL
jgi:hypothetical protein